MSKRSAKGKGKGKKRTRDRSEEDTGPFVPIRDYYHSQSFLKIKDNEWENGEDSDDEEQTWHREVEKSVS